MRVLDFIISAQRIELDPKCNYEGLVSGSAGYLHARFRFSADWSGCKKVAVFSCKGKEYPTPIIHNTCEIPAEALRGTTVEVAVVGKKDNYRITTNTTAFKQYGGH